jgi:N4-(beta-N-acetylglucosaminyl)-L-asparaginase
MCALQLGFVATLSLLLRFFINLDDRIQINISDSKLNLSSSRNSPVIINTWPFTDATEAAWKVLKHNNVEGGGTALVAVEAGATKCEELQCDGTVGFGGSPDENGETSLDAMIMDGDTMEVGAVANLRHIKQAVTAARLIKDFTNHALLAGLQASQFAQLMGLEPANLTTDHSAKLHTDWLKSNCQPNFRKNVVPDPHKNCGPYFPIPTLPPSELLQLLNPNEQDSKSRELLWPTADGAHDTISLVALDSYGSMASACSTNGAINKVPGRVGDGAVAGGGSYVDSEVGGCGATGDGELHIRFLPCYQVVENMRNGMGPREAAEDAIYRIVKKLKKLREKGGGGEISHEINYTGAVIALSKDGSHGAASYGWDFSYSYRNEETEGVQIVQVKPLAV